MVQFPEAWPAPGAAVPVAARVGVCLLERRGGAVSRATVSSAEVQGFLKEGLGISRVRFGRGLDEALARLAPAEGWRLSLSANPADAAPHLDAMLTELESHL